MSNKLKKYGSIAAVVVIIILAVAIQYLKNNKNPDKSGSAASSEDQVNTPSEQGQNLSANQLSGTLKISDNLKKGNLMLVLPDKNIYLFTIRDYSALLDKPVIVSIKGTAENFQLMDIIAQ